jgi:hypothetical protein
MQTTTIPQQSSSLVHRLFGLNSQWGLLLELVEANEGIFGETLEAKYAELVDNSEASVDAACAVLRHIEAQEQHLADEIKRLQARKQSLNKHSDRIKAALLAMVQRNGGKVRTASNTLGVNPGKASVDLKEGFAILPAFARVKTELDKAAAAKIFYATPTNEEINALSESEMIPWDDAKAKLEKDLAANAEKLGLYERSAMPFLVRR